MEKIIQTKSCSKCSINFDITDKDLEFYNKISPVFDWKKYEVPTPTFCPECRQQRRLSFRNERKLYKRKCDATGENIISIYSTDKNYKVYSSDFWWSDKWDALDYWLDFDFNKWFFNHFEYLIKKVPLLPSIAINNENSDYTQLSSYNKNCYLLFNGSYNEDLHYSYWVQNNNKCIDLYWTSSSELSYENIDSKKIFKWLFLINCISCNNSIFLKNCINCKECILSSNLNWKKYFILNEEYSKEDYFNKKEDIYNNFYKYKKRFLEEIAFWKNIIVKEVEKESSENCTWSYIEDSSNCYNCFDIKKSEDCKYCYNVFELKDSMDVNFFWFPSELLYEANNVWLNSFWILFSNYLYNCQNVIYSYNCHNSSNIFWCVWLKNKEYCILNKQYTKEEYNKLVPKIIEKMKETWEWWEFFPSSISPFWYNETVAQEYFPLSNEEIIKQNFNYSTYEPSLPNVSKIIPAEKLPENIKDIPDDILNWAIKCEVTWKPFRIIKQELEFYRKHNLPIPKKHPDQRHLERMKLRNPRKLFVRSCDKCEVEMKSTYSADREEIVYCEDCYNKEVY